MDEQSLTKAENTEPSTALETGLLHGCMCLFRMQRYPLGPFHHELSALHHTRDAPVGQQWNPYGRTQDPPFEQQ